MELIRTDYGRAKRTVALNLTEDIVKDINVELSDYVYKKSKEYTVEVNLKEVEDIAKCITDMPEYIDEYILDLYKVEIGHKSNLVDNTPVLSYLGDIVKELLDDYLYDSYDYIYDFDGEASEYWVE